MTTTLALWLLFAAPQQDLSTIFDQAQTAMRQHEYRTAIPLLQQVLKARPDNADLLMELGIAEHLTGQSAAAIQNLKGALSRKPESFGANLYLGFAYLTTGDPSKAVLPLRKAYESQPSQSAAAHALLDALWQSGDFAGAVTIAQSCVARDEADAHAWYMLGRSRSEQAARAFASVIHEAPGSAYAAVARATDLLHLPGHGGDALAALHQALRADPSLAPAHFGAAEIYRATGHLDWEQTERGQLASLDCSHRAHDCDWLGRRWGALVLPAESSDSLAADFWRAEAFAGWAQDAFGHLLALDPSPERFRYEATLHGEAGRPNEVVSSLRKASALAPDDRSISHELAAALFFAHDYGASLQLCQQLLNDEPGSWELQSVAGDSLLELQRPEEAISFLRAAAATARSNPAISASLGRAYAATGQWSLALPALQNASAADRDGTVHYQLARTYAKLGNAREAQKALEEYKALNTAATALSTAIIAPD